MEQERAGEIRWDPVNPVRLGDRWATKRSPVPSKKLCRPRTKWSPGKVPGSVRSRPFAWATVGDNSEPTPTQRRSTRQDRRGERLAQAERHHEPAEPAYDDRGDTRWMRMKRCVRM